MGAGEGCKPSMTMSSIVIFTGVLAMSSGPNASVLLVR